VFGASEIGPSDTTSPSSTPWKLQAIPDQPVDDGLCEQIIIKLKLHLAGYSPSVPASALTRRKFEGTDITLFQSAATHQLSHVHLSVALLHARCLSDQQAKDKTTEICVGEVLQEVWRQLWLSGAADAAECGIVLPTGMRINNTEYGAGEKQSPHVLLYSLVYCGS
jgi:hypothetical protein